MDTLKFKNPPIETGIGSIELGILFLDSIGRTVSGKDINQAIESSSFSTLLISERELGFNPKFAKDALRLTSGQSTVQVVHQRLEPRCLLFSRAAWKAIGGFDSDAIGIEMFGHFIKKAQSVRSFSILELSPTKPQLDIEVPPDRAEEKASKENEKKRVLFFAPYGAWQNHNVFDAVLATALRLRGVEVCVVTCDGLFQESCYVLGHSRSPAHDCQLCSQKGKSLFKSFGLNVIQLRDFVLQDDVSSIDRWLDSLDVETFTDVKFQGLPAGRWVTPIVCSYFRVPVDHFKTPRVKAVHKRYISYSLTTYRALSRIFDEFQPTNVVMLNGNGFVHPAAFALAKEREIPVLTHEAGYFTGSFLMVDNDVSAAITPQLKVIDAWKDIPLSTEELETTRQYIIDREQGKGLNRLPFYNFNDAHVDVRRKLNIPNNAKIVSVFTSSEYELVYSREFDNVPSQFTIIDELIKQFADRDEYLVIRHHPYIGGIGGGTYGPPDYSLIKKAYEQALNAPPNVRIIMPDERLTSYSLLWNSVAAVTFYSAVGPEAVARGVPASGLSFTSTGRMITHPLSDVSPDSVRKLVEDLLTYSDKFGVEDLRRLYRGMYGLFFRYSNVFNAFVATAEGDFTVNLKAIDDLREGTDPSLDRACDHIIKGTSIYKSPSEMDKARTTTAEDAFFVEELKKIKEYRTKVATDLEAVNRADESATVRIISLKSPDLISTQNTEVSWRNRLRHKGAQFEHVSVQNLGQGAIQSILNRLSAISEEYVIVTHECFQYDESFIDSSLEFAKGLTNQYGVMWGGWIHSLTDPSGKTTNSVISDTIFTKRHPTETYRHAISMLPLLSNPLVLLGFSMIKRTSLIDLLSQVSNFSDQNDLGRNIYEFSMSNLLRTGNPMVIIHPSRFVDRGRYSFSLGGTRFDCAPTESRISIVEESLIASPEVSKMIQEVVDHMNSNRDNEALTLVQRITNTRRDIPDLFYIQGLVQARLGKNTEALRSLMALLERAPQHQAGRALFNDLRSRLVGSTTN